MKRVSDGAGFRKYVVRSDSVLRMRPPVAKTKGTFSWKQLAEPQKLKRNGKKVDVICASTAKNK